MSPIPVEEVFNRFKAWFLKQSRTLQEDILLFVYRNRPRKNIKLSELMGEENTGKGFDIDLAQGQASERMLQGILSGKVEVKTDFKVGDTGNVAIEVECYNKPSGIQSTESGWWAIVFGGPKYKKEVIVLITTERLEKLIHGARTVRGGDNGAATMYLIKKERLLDEV